MNLDSAKGAAAPPLTPPVTVDAPKKKEQEKIQSPSSVTEAPVEKPLLPREMGSKNGSKHKHRQVTTVGGSSVPGSEEESIPGQESTAQSSRGEKLDEESFQVAAKSKKKKKRKKKKTVPEGARVPGPMEKDSDEEVKSKPSKEALMDLPGIPGDSPMIQVTSDTSKKMVRMTTGRENPYKITQQKVDWAGFLDNLREEGTELCIAIADAKGYKAHKKECDHFVQEFYRYLMENHLLSDIALKRFVHNPGTKKRVQGFHLGLLMTLSVVRKHQLNEAMIDSEKLAEDLKGKRDGHSIIEILSQYCQLFMTVIHEMKQYLELLSITGGAAESFSLNMIPDASHGFVTCVALFLEKIYDPDLETILCKESIFKIFQPLSIVTYKHISEAFDDYSGHEHYASFWKSLLIMQSHLGTIGYLEVVLKNLKTVYAKQPAELNTLEALLRMKKSMLPSLVNVEQLGLARLTESLQFLDNVERIDETVSNWRLPSEREVSQFTLVKMTSILNSVRLNDIGEKGELTKTLAREVRLSINDRLQAAEAESLRKLDALRKLLSSEDKPKPGKIESKGQLSSRMKATPHKKKEDNPKRLQPALPEEKPVAVKAAISRVQVMIHDAGHLLNKTDRHSQKQGLQKLEEILLLESASPHEASQIYIGMAEAKLVNALEWLTGIVNCKRIIGQYSANIEAENVPSGRVYKNFTDAVRKTPKLQSQCSKLIESIEKDLLCATQFKDDPELNLSITLVQQRMVKLDDAFKQLQAVSTDLAALFQARKRLVQRTFSDRPFRQQEQRRPLLSDADKQQAVEADKQFEELMVKWKSSFKSLQKILKESQETQGAVEEPGTVAGGIDK